MSVKRATNGKEKKSGHQSTLNHIMKAPCDATFSSEEEAEEEVDVEVAAFHV